MIYFLFFIKPPKLIVVLNSNLKIDLNYIVIIVDKSIMYWLVFSGGYLSL